MPAHRCLGWYLMHAPVNRDRPPAHARHHSSLAAVLDLPQFDYSRQQITVEYVDCVLC
jgi:hypothetical protein